MTIRPDPKIQTIDADYGSVLHLTKEKYQGVHSGGQKALCGAVLKWGYVSTRPNLTHPYLPLCARCRKRM